MSSILGIVLSQVLLQAGAAPEQAAVPRVAVLDLQAVGEGETQVAALLSQALTQELAGQGLGQVLSMAELRALLDTAAKQQLLGCDDARCLADLSGGLAVDLLVSGQVGRIGGQRLVSLALIDTKQLAVKARSSHLFGLRTAPGKAMKASVQKLLDRQAEERGDRALADLRVALLVDEYDAEGALLKLRRLEGCASKAASEAGATLVSAAQIARIRKLADARKLLEQDPLELLGSEDADLVIVATAQYQPGATAPGLEVHNMHGGLQAQIINLDSGEVVATVQLEQRQPGYGPQDAMVKVSRKLCASLKPELKKALGRRFERGRRVVVTLTGVADLAAAEQLAQELKKHSGASRSRVRAFRKGRATVDVVTPGLDGLGLGLKLQASGARFRVLEAGSGTLKLAS